MRSFAFNYQRSMPMTWSTQYRRVVLALAASSILTIPACDEDSPLGSAGGELAEQCGLTCPAEGILEGNASISGVAKVDSFFRSVVTFTARADMTANRIQTELGRIKASLGLEANADADAIVAAISTRYRLEGGLAVRAQPARCAVSAQATVQAQARCEGTVNPGSVSVDCEGSCEVEASGAVQCNGTLECTGTAPNLNCEGTCQGSCELTAAAECTGTCRGTCEGNCSAENADGQCAGTCDGECQGTCELQAGGTCDGECRGQCTYTPPNAMCNGTARCTAMANATVKCEGRCEGEVTPPSASAECQASAKAEASLDVECTPPSIDISYQFAANANAQTQAEFQAFLVGFRARFSAILAELERANVLVELGGDIVASAEGAVNDAVNVAIDGDASLKAQIGLGCALAELENVGRSINGATGRLQTQVTAAAALSGELVTD
jgi:hypothetical protein